MLLYRNLTIFDDFDGDDDAFDQNSKLLMLQVVFVFILKLHQVRLNKYGLFFFYHCLLPLEEDVVELFKAHHFVPIQIGLEQIQV